MATELNLAATNNATWTYSPLSLLVDDAPVALPAGTTVRMQLREAPDSVNVALELTLENKLLTFQDEPAAVLALEVPAITMKDLPAGDYAYDVVVEQPSGRVVRPIFGKVTVAQGVTR